MSEEKEYGKQVAFTDEELQIIAGVIGETTVQIKSPMLNKLLVITAKIHKALQNPKEK